MIVERMRRDNRAFSVRPYCIYGSDGESVLVTELSRVVVHLMCGLICVLHA